MKKSNLFYIFPVIFFFSIYVNYLSGNIGILPIDHPPLMDLPYLKPESVDILDSATSNLPPVHLSYHPL